MFQLFFLSLSTILSYIFSISPFQIYTIQIIAIFTTIFLFLSLYHHQQLFNKNNQSFIILISFIINLIIFNTNGLNSPAFFLVYFLLFTIAFQNPPPLTLAYSLVLIIFLSQSLNSNQSVLPLISLLFISPLSYFISQQQKQLQKTNQDVTTDETSIFLWYSTIFKTRISSINDSLSILLSQPQLPQSSIQLLKKIKRRLKSLSKSTAKLTRQIDQQTD